MNSFDEIIQYAMEHEEKEAAFYEEMAERSESKDQKEAMLVHANEEREHKKHLEKIQKNHHLPGGARRYPDPDLKISDYLVVEDHPGTVSYEEALLLAAKREKAAQKLYLQMAAAADDAELKEVFNFLAEQEGKHGSRLEAEYDDTLKEG
ncbi:MAG: ferritin family protein [Magnetococcales bacterium]|nr:ferritin family protein [Magnetococcales bacterium]